MKEVILRLPRGKEMVVSGDSEDLSIIGAIESQGGYYEPHVMRAMDLLIKPDFICLDIGANIGVMSLQMASAASNGHVYAFEPSPTNFKNLCKNVFLNTVSNITPIPVGVGDRECIAEFNYVPSVAGCSFISTTGVREGIQEQVRIVTVDSVVSEKGISRVDFIKLDVEGAERPVLIGSLDTLKRFRPVMIMEFNPVPIKRFYGENPYDLYVLLNEIYPNIYRIQDKSFDFIKITSYEMLESLVAKGKGWEDLLCTTGVAP